MSECSTCRPSREGPWPEMADAEVIEIPLLLPRWQISALETAAHRHGLTAGEMVRSLLRDSIRRLSRTDPGQFEVL
jgi:hypothetical protein